jgi:hypothetical protein
MTWLPASTSVPSRLGSSSMQPAQLARVVELLIHREAEKVAKHDHDDRRLAPDHHAGAEADDAGLADRRGQDPLGEAGRQATVTLKAPP